LAIRGGSQDEWINNMENKPTPGTEEQLFLKAILTSYSNFVDLQIYNQDMVLVLRKLKSER
jgi:hypothetical protein